MKSGNLNFLEACGPLQVCNRTTLPIMLCRKYGWIFCLSFRNKITLFNNRWTQQVNVGTNITSYTDVTSHRRGAGFLRSWTRRLQYISSSVINTYFLEIVSYVSDAGNVCKIGCLRSVDSALCKPPTYRLGPIEQYASRPVRLRPTENYRWISAFLRHMTSTLCDYTETRIARAERDDTRAETRFRLSPKRTSPFKLVGASVQSTAGSRGVRISFSNSGYTTFGGGVRVLATYSIRQFPLHFPSRTSPCTTTFRTSSNTYYKVQIFLLSLFIKYWNTVIAEQFS